MIDKYWWKFRYLILLLGIVIGIVIFGVCKLYSLNVLKKTLSEDIEMELGEDTFQLVIGNSYQDSNMGMNSYIKWWYKEAENVYYLFLPKSWEGDFRLFWAFNNAEEIRIDGKAIRNGDTFYEDEGTYTVTVNDNEYQVEVMYSSNIPSLFMEIGSGSLDYINESKEHLDTAEYILFDEKGNLNNSGHIAEISCRGNATFEYIKKKSYHIELQEKSQILNLGAEKDWLLISNAFDSTLSRNVIVHNMANALDMAYVPDVQYVDVYANGEYIGNYMLSEKIEIDSERVNIRDLEEETKLLNPEVDFSACEQVVEDPDKLFSRKWFKIPSEPEDYTGGYLMEIEWSDRYGVDPSGFISSRMLPVVVHSPKYASLNQIGYIADIYQDFEDAVFSEDGYNEKTGKYFYEYIDMESFVTKYMIEELVKNMDASYTSCFLYKPENDEKMYAGPVWDYDGSIFFEWISDEGIDLADPEGLYVALEKRDGDIWYALYQQLYFRQYVDSLCETKFEETINEFTDTFIDENAEFVVDSALMNAVRWDRLDAEGLDAKRELFFEMNEELEDFLETRLQYLSEEWEYGE